MSFFFNSGKQQALPFLNTCARTNFQGWHDCRAIIVHVLWRSIGRFFKIHGALRRNSSIRARGVNSRPSYRSELLLYMILNRSGLMDANLEPYIHQRYVKLKFFESICSTLIRNLKKNLQRLLRFVKKLHSFFNNLFHIQKTL